MPNWKSWKGGLRFLGWVVYVIGVEIVVLFAWLRSEVLGWMGDGDEISAGCGGLIFNIPDFFLNRVQSIPIVVISTCPDERVS